MKESRGGELRGSLWGGRLHHASPEIALVQRPKHDALKMNAFGPSAANHVEQLERYLAM